MDMVRTIPAILVLWGLTTGAIWADDAAKPPADAKKAPDDAKKLGSDEAAYHTMCRAGYPLVVSSHARPTDVPGFCGYWVGGGSLKLSGSVTPPSPELGTWGRDWTGYCRAFQHVMLGWGGRYQDGMGSYAASGREVPDFIAAIIACPGEHKARRCETESEH
jgi:hypothetical protein